MTSKRDREEEAQFEELKRMRVIGEFQPPAGFDPSPVPREVFQHGEPSPPPPAMESKGAYLMLNFETARLRQEFESWMVSTAANGGWPRFGDWRDSQPGTGDH